MGEHRQIRGSIFGGTLLYGKVWNYQSRVIDLCVLIIPSLLMNFVSSMITLGFGVSTAGRY